MKTIKFDSGEQRYRVGAGELRFNPCDPALYDRFLKAAQALESYVPEPGPDAVEKADAAIHRWLGEIFGPRNDLSAIFPGSLLALGDNGKPVAVNFLEALEDILTQGARRYAESRLEGEAL